MYYIVVWKKTWIINNNNGGGGYKAKKWDTIHILQVNELCMDA